MDLLVFTLWGLFTGTIIMSSMGNKQQEIVAEEVNVSDKTELIQEVPVVKEIVEIVEPAKAKKVEAETAEADPIKAETTPVEPVPAKTETLGFHRMKDAEGQYVTVTLKPGSRLTLVALQQFGDKAFWPYIFEVNSDRLKAPDLVQAGMVLYLPDPAFYGIDAKDPASVQKAKNKATQLLK